MAERRPTRAEHAIAQIIRFALGAVAFIPYATGGRLVFRYFSEGVSIPIGIRNELSVIYFTVITVFASLMSLAGLIMWLCWALGEPDKPRADDPWSEPGD